ncbi:MAG: hypothetical protein JXR10_03785 [Cyclobacteriaceae bacterium]
MTLEQLSRLNEKFQTKASNLAELLPGGNLVTFSTATIRSAKKIDILLKKVLTVKGEQAFYTNLDKLEEEMDELIFLMDRLDQANREQKIRAITDTAKKGYELISLYGLCCDQIIEKKSRLAKEI